MASPVKLAANMTQRRDDMRRLLGAHYKASSLAARSVIFAVALEDGIGIAEAGLKVAKRMSAAGVDPSIVIAAVVDECEGSF